MKKTSHKPTKKAMHNDYPTNKSSIGLKKGYNPPNNEFHSTPNSRCGRTTPVTHVPRDERLNKSK